MNKLKSARIGRGWTQSYVAGIAKVSQSRIARYEAGDIPSPKTAALLARVFAPDLTEMDLLYPPAPPAAETPAPEPATA